MIADLLPKIAADMAREQGDHAYRPRPSSAGPERCVRAQVYHARGFEQAPLPGRAQLVFDDSSWHEELSLDWIRRTAFQVHSEQMEVETPVGVGKIDSLLTDILGNDWLLEHKAINHFSFERYALRGVIPYDYIAQTVLYLRGLQKVNPRLTRGLLLIKNKNTAQYMELWIEDDPARDAVRVTRRVTSLGDDEQLDFVWPNVVAEIKGRFALVEKHRAAGTLPDRPFSFGTDFPCGYCRWAAKCWDGYLEEFGAAQEGVDLGDNGAVDAIVRYRAASDARAVAEKDHEAAKVVLLNAMKAANARKATAGPYNLSVAIQSRSSLDASLIPDDVREKATRVSTFPVLRVSKIKEATK